MDRTLTLLGGIGLGAGLAYFLDPQLGRRRRAILRDNGIHWLRQLGDTLETTGRDVSNRAHGLLAETKARLGHEDGASDDVIASRVRSKVGRIVSHPRAIEIAVHDGHVSLRGP